jgi:hypothetical protein
MTTNLDLPGVPSKFWNVDHWVKFRLLTDTYENFIAFLNANGLSFLAQLELNFDNIPINLHGKGVSKNLEEFLSKNTDDVSLILRFLYYFITDIIDMRYNSGKKIIFHFFESSTWQSMNFDVSGPYVPPTTTLIPTTELPTTTPIPRGFSWFSPEL